MKITSIRNIFMYITIVINQYLQKTWSVMIIYEQKFNQALTIAVFHSWSMMTEDFVCSIIPLLKCTRHICIFWRDGKMLILYTEHKIDRDRVYNKITVVFRVDHQLTSKFVVVHLLSTLTILVWWSSSIPYSYYYLILLLNIYECMYGCVCHRTRCACHCKHTSVDIRWYICNKTFKHMRALNQLVACYIF